MCYAGLRDKKKKTFLDILMILTEYGSTYQTLEHVVGKYSVTSQSLYQTWLETESDIRTCTTVLFKFNMLEYTL